MFACLHVCVFACLHVCMFACLHVCMFACLHVCIVFYLFVCVSKLADPSLALYRFALKIHVVWSIFCFLCIYMLKVWMYDVQWCVYIFLLSTCSLSYFLCSCLTTFAFVWQLYVNYRLKSVAHLPLRAFMYKVSHPYWPQGQNILIARHYVGRVDRIFSVRGVILAVWTEYSQCGALYWPCGENILIARHYVGRVARLFSLRGILSNLLISFFQICAQLRRYVSCEYTRPSPCSLVRPPTKCDTDDNQLCEHKWAMR
jgi:hypothetical protein